MASKDLVFRFLGVDAGAGREFDRMAGKASKTAGAITKIGLGLVATGATVAVESIRMASKFQTAMELIHTQAGATQGEVTKMSTAILALAGPTATAPGELAKGLYHLESAGFRGSKALAALKTAAEGAKIGGANLEDVTNALNATLVSGIKGAQNMSQAMGALNATVGAGDMRMQDLAEALGTGVLAAVKGFGLSLNDVGAALATFGDNNIRGADAATQLRMAVLFMAKPAASAKNTLKELGLTSHTLADDLRERGLGGALKDLHDHLIKAGDTGAKQGQVLLDLFGHRAGTGISILEQQFSRFQQKQEQVAHGSRNFASDWHGYTKTFGYSWDRAKSAFESMTIQLGTKLLPIATHAMNWLGTTGVKDIQNLIKELGHVGSWVKDNSDWLKPLVESVAGLAVAYKLLKTAHSIGGTLGKLPGVGKLAGDLGVQKVYVVNMPPGGIGPGGGPVSTAENDAKKYGPATLPWLSKGAKWLRIPPEIGVGGALAFVGAAATDKLGKSVGGFIPPVVGAALRGMPKSEQGKAFADYEKSVGFGTSLKNALPKSKDMADVDKWLQRWGYHLKGVTAERNRDADSIDAERAQFVALRLEVLRHNQAVADSLSGLKKIPGAFAALVAKAKAAGVSIGAALDAGLTIGITQNGGKVNFVSKQLVGDVLKTMSRRAEQGSPSKVTTRLGQDIALGLPVGFKKMMPHVLAVINAEMKKLAAAVKSATDKLKTDLSAQGGLAASIRGNFLGTSDVGSAFDSNGNLGAFDFTHMLQGNLGKLKTLARYLGTLRKQGLSPLILQQIGALPLDQALAAAQSFATGGQGAISQINLLENQVQATGLKAGGQIAQSLYASAIAKDRAELRKQTKLHEEEVALLHIIARKIGANPTAAEITAELKAYKRKTGRNLGLA